MDTQPDDFDAPFGDAESFGAPVEEPLDEPVAFVPQIQMSEFRFGEQPLTEAQAVGLGGGAAPLWGMELLGGAPTYNFSELVAKTGLPRKLVEDYWLWLGMPVKDSDGKLFTDYDVDSLQELEKLLQAEGLSNSAAASLVRSTGQTGERVVTWQIEALIEDLAQQKHLDDTTARRLVVQHLPQIAENLAQQADHSYRWGLARVIQRNALEVQHRKPRPAEDPLPAPRAVGFADIVGYTQRTAIMEPDQLAAYVRDHESRARDLVNSYGGRVVKTVGDAVLFVADALETGVQIALSLAATHTNAEIETPVRVGMVWGQVLQRFGDVFGSRVNLAARLTDLADASTVYVDPSTAALLASNEKYHLAVMPEKQIQGLGLMRPVKITQNAFVSP